MSYREDSITLFSVLDRYAHDYKLPRNLFETPDHMAYTATGIKDFSQKVRELALSAKQLTVIERENRFIATAMLSGTFVVGELGQLNWVTIIEPTDAEQECCEIGKNSLGYYYPDLDNVRLTLGRIGIRTTKEELPTPAVRLPIIENGVNYSVGFYESPLEELVQGDIKAKLATFVNLA